ncbi:phosphomannomutase [Xinfangfangia sp. CPCC 101601]|uniref:Phosphomannomutase n=1 Tax=Pseudogemmobacter lacusdianii TaxID=3069608 RepID=A0ABU0VZ34_9RHOB|nr:phosphomannomutase [Xinfangfangia sp. CPCC 101601]MDQ2067017.1 phosphomannomutase [Xinfangfangia sp. CPCC 101601]
MLSCFKAYDIRGRLGAELNEDIARRIGQAFAEVLGAKTVCVGRDCRASSEALMAATVEGLLAAGAQVLDLGLCGTEEIYHATTHFGADGGIEVTASHNPMDYNGMKMVQRGSAPLEPALMRQIHDLAEAGEFRAAAPGQIREAIGARAAYVKTLTRFVDPKALRPLHILVNCGNGAAGPTFDALAEALQKKGAPLRFTRIHHEPDGSFPNGIPNPLLPENQPVTAKAVRAHGADMGIAFDGDFDRCFFFDEVGSFVPGEYVVALLAAAFLGKENGATIVHDPRVIWATQEAVRRGGGTAVLAPTGHAFLKATMRQTGAAYGGEMSAHHYFRDFMACDSGMIPWLLVAELMGRANQPLSGLVGQMRQDFPSSGEINFRVADVAQAMARVEAALSPEAVAIDRTDGLSLDFGNWRLNLRASNTEPLLRLNVEARGDAAVVSAGVTRLRPLIQG